MLREELQQIPVGSEVDDSSLAVVLHHLGGTPVGGDEHPGDLIRLDRLDEIAVAKGTGSVLGIRTLQEGGAHGNEHDDQEHVEARIAPALFQDRTP